jgi:hypothetical protein
MFFVDAEVTAGPAITDGAHRGAGLAVEELRVGAHERLLAAEFVKIAKKTKVIVGGSWARGAGQGLVRFRSLRAFERWLRQQ